ncbi:hypothetical protein ACLIYM_06940 [Streptomyces fenghuangensis]|uniref:hypothetical protein n=1 Tax=Streptomyces sp. ICN903 TaxID=2964654 RepID=UPI001EDB40F2|nr:hypothetical protein [Streptomyces sp. ICN903]MCG3041044.1 hypothetical protein [Streptomyces sp. ICN903]
MTNSDQPWLAPTGACWCGCGTPVGTGSFFAPGHDKTAEAALLAARYGGSVARLLHHHGFDSGRSVLDAAVREGHWDRCTCGYTGAPASIDNHRRRCAG